MFGAWGDALEDIHMMVVYLAEGRQRHQRLLQGRWRRKKISKEAEIACHTGQIMKILSLGIARIQARILLDRLKDLWDEAAAAS